MRTIGRTLATVKLGVHKTYENCRASLRTNGIKVSPWAEDILEKTPLSQTPTDVELVKVSVAKLSFKKATRFDCICKRIIKLGFDLCPAEAAIMLRESYKNQPKGEWLTVVMEAIIDSDEDLKVFEVVHGGDGLLLGTFYGDPGRLFAPEARFVVARRK